MSSASFHLPLLLIRWLLRSLPFTEDNLLPFSHLTNFCPIYRHHLSSISSTMRLVIPSLPFAYPSPPPPSLFYLSLYTMLASGGWFSLSMLASGGWFSLPMLASGGWFLYPCSHLAAGFSLSMLASGGWFSYPCLHMAAGFSLSVLASGGWLSLSMLASGDCFSLSTFASGG